MRNFIVCTVVRAIKSIRLRCAGHVGRMYDGRSVFNILTGKPRENRHLGSPRCRWKDNIIKNLKEIYINTTNRIDSTQIMFIGEPL